MNMYEKDRQQAIELLKEMGMSDIAKKIDTKEETTIFPSDTEAEREKCLDILKSTNGKEKKSKNTFYTYFGDFYGKSEDIDKILTSLSENENKDIDGTNKSHSKLSDLFNAFYTEAKIRRLILFILFFVTVMIVMVIGLVIGLFSL